MAPHVLQALAMQASQCRECEGNERNMKNKSAHRNTAGDTATVQADLKEITVIVFGASTGAPVLSAVTAKTGSIGTDYCSKSSWHRRNRNQLRNEPGHVYASENAHWRH